MEEGKPDYLSPLPNLPMIGILSRFDFKQLMIFSMASKGIRKRCDIAPKIDVQFHKVSLNGRDGLHVSLGRYLAMRRGVFSVATIKALSTLVLNRVVERTPVINQWISDATHLGMENLTLVLFARDFIDLEIPATCWRKLNSLDLNLCGGSLRLSTEQSSILVTRSS